jgi:hypothetical protein
MEKIKLICPTCSQIIKKNEIHECSKSISDRNQYRVDKKLESFSFNFLSIFKK